MRIVAISFRIGVLTALVLGLAALCQAQVTPLKTAAAVQGLEPAEAALGLPVHLQVVVTLLNRDLGWFMAQDATSGLYVDAQCGPAGWSGVDRIQAGDLIEIRGRTAEGRFAPAVCLSEIRMVGHAGLPEARAVRLEQLESHVFHNRWVEAEGIVSSLRVQQDPGAYPRPDAFMLVVEGRPVRVFAPHGSLGTLRNSLYGARVRVRGVSGALFTGQGQAIGAQIFTDGPRWVEILQSRARHWVDLPLSDLQRLLRYSGPGRVGELVRIHAVVAYASDLCVVLQRGQHSIYLAPDAAYGLQVGDTAKAFGRLNTSQDGFLLLEDAWAHESEDKLPPLDVYRPEPGMTLKYAARGILTELHGRVLSHIRAAEGDLLDIQWGNETVRAEYHRGTGSTNLPEVSAGDQVALVGIFQHGFWTLNSRLGRASLLLRSPADLTVLASRPWWQRVNWLWVAVGMVACLGLAIGWASTLRLRVRARTADLARKSAELEEAMVTARSASEAKSAFLANMSHEIRTPLNGVLGMLALAIEAEGDPRTREDLQWARRSAESLLGILNDVLDLSKIEAGKVELETIDFVLDTVVADSLRIARPEAARKGLRLSLEMPEALSGVYQGDPTRLLQVLNNLLSNAIKFTETGEVRLNLQPDGDRIRFSVTDSGIGIPREKLQLIFAPFEQGDTTITRRFGGTGLGLPISRALVRLMGGDLSASSELGGGSEFSFSIELPRGVLDALPGPTAAPQRVSRSMRILVAEDNQVNRRLFSRLLENAGHRAVLAADGAEALDVFRTQSPFDAILMDLQMPGISGLEAVRQIRSCPEGERVPIVAVTAHAMHGDREYCLANGVDDFLAKPFTAEQFHACLARCAQSHLHLAD